MTATMALGRHILSLDMIFLMFPDTVGQLLLSERLQIPDNASLVHDDERGLLDQVLDVGLLVKKKEVSDLLYNCPVMNDLISMCV